MSRTYHDGKGRRALSAAVGIAMLLAGAGAFAQAWTPERPVELVLASGPGSGPDRMARLLQKIWQDTRTVAVPISVANRVGGGGAVAYGYVHQKAGDGHAIVLGGATLLTNPIMGRSPIGHRELTPVARMVGEYIAVAVRADSPIRDGRDLAERLKATPTALTVGLANSLGNPNHQGLAVALKAAGVDLPKVRTVVFQSGRQALTALLGGHIDVMPSSVGIVIGAAQEGQIRLIAISAPKRLPGKIANVPTWREQGIDAEVSIWRMAIGARGISPAQVAYWEAALKQATQTDEWKAELERFYLSDEFLSGPALSAFLDEQAVGLKALLTDLGLAKNP
jgi:putative tricarboxylic transport membrane protein